MEALVLSWRATGRGGPSLRAAGLATALAAAGAGVRVVTRLGEGEQPARLSGCEVHAVPDAPPIAPVGLDEGGIARLTVAGTALAVAARRLRERPADVVVTVGRDVVDAAVRLPGRAPLLLDPGPAGPAPVTPTLVGLDRPLVLAAPTTTAVEAWAASGVEVELLPAAAPAPNRLAAPPRADAPVRLVASDPVVHRSSADRLRHMLRGVGDRRRVTRLDRRRPAVAVVVAPTAVDAVLRAAVRRVPVVAVRGPVGDLVVDLGCGLVVTGVDDAVAAAVGLLADREAAARFGDAGPEASAAARTAAVTTVRAVVSAHERRPQPPLRAIG